MLDRILAGDLRAVARAATLVERREANDLLKQLFPHTGRALLLGVTGSPGAGKSTLVNRFIHQLREPAGESGGLRVAVIAIDPTSPFTGGAILGDRIRMLDHYRDEKVFIRSMATRGQLGGLAPAAADMTLLLDAAGFDVIIIETVGVGQDEIEIAKLAHVSIVVLTPNMGDDVQAIKAGIMEIADIFAINKADLGGAEKLERELNASQGHAPVFLVSAQEGSGLAEILAVVRQCQKLEQDPCGSATVDRHLPSHAALAPLFDRVSRKRNNDPGLWSFRLREMLRERLLEQYPQEMFESAARQVAAKSTDPYTVVEGWLNREGIE